MRKLGKVDDVCVSSANMWERPSYLAGTSIVLLHPILPNLDVIQIILSQSTSMCDTCRWRGFALVLANHFSLFFFFLFPFSSPQFPSGDSLRAKVDCHISLVSNLIFIFWLLFLSFFFNFIFQYWIGRELRFVNFFFNLSSTR